MEPTELAFDSGSVMCAADLYWLANPEGPVPCVVMGYGFSGTKDMGLRPYAERFAAAGMAAVAFDYRHFGASGGSPRQLVRVGRASEMRVTQAAHSRADLIVMTTHGRGGVARFWLGSVADVLVRTSPVPVLLMRPDEGVHEHRELPIIQRILIPLDGSEQSEAILDHALALGQLMDAEYTLLRVVAPLVLGAGAPFTTPTDFDPDRTRRLEVEAEGYLDGVAQRLRGRGAQVQTRVLISEQVAPSILEEAQQHGAHLIAMATGGRSGLARLLIGSVADKVLRRAEMPLLLYRPEALPEHEGHRVTSSEIAAPQLIVQEDLPR